MSRRVFLTSARRSPGVAALLLTLLSSAPALADETYVGSGVLLGSSRTVALGGASVGLAEGIDGLATNPAAVAHRSPTLDQEWDLAAGLSSLSFSVGNPSGQDFDGDGAPDLASSTTNLLAGLMFQYRWFGVGFASRWSRSAYPADPLSPDAAPLGRAVDLFRTTLAFGAALHQDEWLLSAGFHALNGTFSNVTGNDGFAGSTFELGVLYRPLGQPFRIGAAFHPSLVAARTSFAEPQPLEPVFPLRVPASLSVGASYRFGDGAERHNALSPVARDELGLAPELPERPRGLLVSAQLDAVLPVAGARVFHATAGAPVGAVFQLTPRLGVEHETWRDRLRLRGGSYWEASPFEGQPGRPHLTGGFELFLFHNWRDFSASFSFDLAPRYRNLGLSFGLWR